MSDIVLKWLFFKKSLCCKRSCILALLMAHVFESWHFAAPLAVGIPHSWLFEYLLLPVHGFFLNFFYFGVYFYQGVISLPGGSICGITADPLYEDLIGKNRPRSPFAQLSCTHTERGCANEKSVNMTSTLLVSSPVLNVQMDVIGDLPFRGVYQQRLQLYCVCKFFLFFIMQYNI